MRPALIKGLTSAAYNVLHQKGGIAVETKISLAWDADLLHCDSPRRMYWNIWKLIRNAVGPSVGANREGLFQRATNLDVRHSRCSQNKGPASRATHRQSGHGERCAVVCGPVQCGDR